MITDLMTRLEQLQQELDEAQQIANNNYRLYATAKEQRYELLEALKKIVSSAGNCEQFIVFQRIAEAAIAKAEGR